MATGSGFATRPTSSGIGAARHADARSPAPRPRPSGQGRPARRSRSPRPILRTVRRRDRRGHRARSARTCSTRRAAGSSSRIERPASRCSCPRARPRPASGAASGSAARSAARTARRGSAPTPVRRRSAARGDAPLDLRVAPSAAHEWRLVRVRGDVVEVHRSGDRWQAELLVGGRAGPDPRSGRRRDPEQRDRRGPDGDGRRHRPAAVPVRHGSAVRGRAPVGAATSTLGGRPTTRAPAAASGAATARRPRPRRPPRRGRRPARAAAAAATDIDLVAIDEHVGQTRPGRRPRRRARRPTASGSTTGPPSAAVVLRGRRPAGAGGHRARRRAERDRPGRAIRRQPAPRHGSSSTTRPAIARVGDPVVATGPFAPGGAPSSIEPLAASDPAGPAPTRACRSGDRLGSDRSGARNRRNRARRAGLDRGDAAAPAAVPAAARRPDLGPPGRARRGRRRVRSRR